VNAHALRVLEFAGALDLVAGRATSELGAVRIHEMQPNAERNWIESEHSRVTLVRALAEGDLGWSPPMIPDARKAIARLQVEGAALAPADFVAIGGLLRSSRLARGSLVGDRVPALASAILRGEIDDLISAPAEEKMIGRAVDDDGNVRDEASPALRRIRRELRGSQGELVKLLERIAAKLDASHRVPDSSVTVRNGRFVIPVRREARSAVGGIVHDTSTTGATLFIEPPAAVEAGNRIRELETEEIREIDRILSELSDALRPVRDELAASLDALVELDTLYARARFARDLDCGSVEFCAPRDGFSISNGRHPLLLSQQRDVVPFDLELLPGERTLLISGPNTGGKTVLLKSLGLFAAMSQAGIPVPVGNGSRVAIFDEVFADVGDEQSISSSLSTFSAHLRNLSEVLQSATPDSLVLIDELGSGTDPVEGAALGGAVLESLTRRECLSVATTHLGALKELATEVDGIVNASLQFDAVALAPTYRLIKGIPGRSYGLSIARRLALPEDVLTRAEARLPTGERDVNALLEELTARQERLTKTERETETITADLKQRAHRLAERESSVREREQNSERKARQEARRLLLDARAEIERTIRELRESAAASAEDAARDARRRVEQLAAEQARAVEELESQSVASRAESPREWRAEIGDYVTVPALAGGVARLMEIRGDDAVVVAGSVKITAPLVSLGRADSPNGGERVEVPIRGDLPEFSARSEIDVRGLRAAEIDDLVMQAVDSAVRGDLKSLRIIHGKGTGALRERVAEMLSKESRVARFRLGAWNEGGAGVTVAELE
jgi:DNA mismatch repair protein MutS2